MHSGAHCCVVRRFAAALLGLLLGSCRDSNAPVAADTLATARVLSRGGSATVASSVSFRLSITAPATDILTNGADLFGEIPLQNGDKGKRLIATAATEGEFDRFASFLTNGINDQVEWTVFPRGGGGGGERSLESSFFVGRRGGGVDFAGYAITSIEFHVDSILLATPGSDPNRDGMWTESYLRGNVVVFGHRK